MEATTANPKGTNFTFTNTTKSAKMIDYPGGISVVEVKAEGTKEGDDTGNDYTFKFKLDVKSTGDSTVDLNWKLYKADESKIDGALLDFGTCALVTNHAEENQDGGAGSKNYYYYYTSDGQKYDSLAAIGTSNKDCKADTTAVGLATKIGSSPIATGTIKSGVVAIDGDVSGAGIAEQSVSTATNKGVEYYYLVLEYPNDNSNQNSGGTARNINVTVALKDGSEVAVEATPVGD